MSKSTVVVIGDFMIDRYWIGRAERISPEAPIPVVKIEEVREFPGGAGNVAANLEALGCEVKAFNPYWMPRPIKNRLMVDDHQLARWDENDICYHYLPKEFPKVDAIIIADYGKGGITQSVINGIKAAHEIFNIPIFVDTKRDPSVWSGVATAIFPNAKEYQQFSIKYLNGDFLVIQKRGCNGLSMRRQQLDYDKTIWELESPSQARFVRSVNGAGDSVISAFVYKYLLEESIINKDENFEQIKWQNCLDFANAAAAIACEHPYTYAPTLKEVEDRYYDIS